MQRIRFLAAAVCAAVLAGGCALVLGIDEFTDQVPGAGGAGGAGGGIGECTPAAQESCYSGAPGTEGVGICRPGARTCDAAGSWGSCEGEVTPAVERCAAPEDESCDTFDCIIWAVAFEQEGSFEPADVASDRDGNVLVAGYFGGTITVAGQTFSSAGSTDGLVIKLSPAGQPLWAKKVGDILEDGLFAVAADSMSNVILAGRTSSDLDFGGGPVPKGLVVIKLDPAGEHLWSTGFGGEGYLIDIAIDSNDNAVVVGAFSQAIDFGQGPVAPAGGHDIVVAKLRGTDGSATASGSWVQTFGAALDQNAWAVALDTSNNIFMAGSFIGTFDFGGFGGIASHSGGEDGFLVKLTPGGSASWVQTFGDGADQRALGVAVDASGRPVVAGEFAGQIAGVSGPLVSSGGHDAFVMKYSPSGGLLWASAFGDLGDQGARGLALDTSDNVVIAGYAAGQIDFGGGALTVAGDLDAFVAKLSPEGAHVWSRLLGGEAEDAVWAVATSPSGETLTASTSRATTIDFGTGPLNGGQGNQRSLVIAKLGM